MATEHTKLENKIRVMAHAIPGVRLERNKVARARRIMKKKLGPPELFGLGVGTPDLVGYKSKTITAMDVGKTFAIVITVEVKTENDDLSDEQEDWRDILIDEGVIYIEARDLQETLEIIRNA